MKEQIILFGCGGVGYEALQYFGEKLVYCFVDNNSNMVGTKKYEKEVISFDKLLEIYKDYYVIISVNHQNTYELLKQFESNNINDYIIFEELKSKPDFLMSNPIELIRLYSSELECAALQRDVYKEKVKELEKKIDYLISHTNVSSLKPATGLLRQRQIDIVNFADDFLKQINHLEIKPFLIAGNLLGHIRHDGFIPWDDDIDFGLIRDEYRKLYDYCRNNFFVAEYDGKDEDLLKWINNTTIEHQNEIILFVYSNQIQISKGTSCIDRLAIDFFAFDYYKEDYIFQEHLKYIKNVKRELEKLSTEMMKIRYIESEIMNSKNIVEDSNNLYFGIDNVDSFKKGFNRNWIPKDVIFPLNKVLFEGKLFWVPGNPEEFIKYEYNDYNSFPKEFGAETHSYWNKFKIDNLINVEFYLIDAFEISHFKPIYTYLRQKGINAIFVAEKNELNTASNNWFNYDEAIRILEENALEYKTECNINADFAFTTQEISILRKYKNTYKINISYGFGLNKNSFAHSIQTLKGFDYRFVHGEFSRDKLSELSSDSKIKIFGYPRHYCKKHKKVDVDKIKSQLGIRTNKKIICYLPTWDEDSSIIKFRESVKALKNEYYIVTKPHHLTCRNIDKQEELAVLHEISDMVLECEYDFESFVNIGDVIICDAKSGASLESCLVNREAKVIFLSVKENMQDYFYDEIFDIAYVINKPEELQKTVEVVCEYDQYQEKRAASLKRFFSCNDTDYLEDIYMQIFEEVKSKGNAFKG